MHLPTHIFMHLPTHLHTHFPTHLHPIQEPLLALRLVLLRALGCPRALASSMVNKASCARSNGQLSSALEALLGARAVLQETGGAVGYDGLNTAWAIEDARLLWDQV